MCTVRLQDTSQPNYKGGCVSGFWDVRRCELQVRRSRGVGGGWEGCVVWCEVTG